MKQPVVVLAVLDWGLGHATRSMAVVRALQQLQCRVILASAGTAGKLLRYEFPELCYYDLPPYDMRYDGGVMLGILRRLPRIFQTIRRERRALAAIALAEKPILIISDNRYGCFHPEIHSVMICHQPHAPVPFLRRIAVLIHVRLLKRFREVWIPDFPDRRLSGELSETFGLPHRFIGVLSRFLPDTTPVVTKKWHIAAFASGPEPARSNFIDAVLPELISTGKPCLLLTADPDQPMEMKGQVTLVGHLPSSQFAQELQSSQVVVCRSGYTGVMDCVQLGIRPIVIPTSGQGEQEYVAKRLANQGFAIMQTEDHVHLTGLDTEIEKLRIPEPGDDHLLLTALRSVVS